MAACTIDLDRDIFMGHEFSAEVLEAGPDTEAPTPGHARHLATGAACPHRCRTDCLLATIRSAAMPSGCCCRRRC